MYYSKYISTLWFRKLELIIDLIFQKMVSSQITQGDELDLVEFILIYQFFQALWRNTIHVPKLKAQGVKKKAPFLFCMRIVQEKEKLSSLEDDFLPVTFNCR